MNGMLAAAWPQLSLACGVVALMATGLGEKAAPRLYRWVCAAALILAGWLAWRAGMSEALGADGWTRSWHILFVAGGLAFIVLARTEQETSFALALGSVLGMSVLAAARTYLGLFIGLELMSLPAYLLVYATRRTRESLEAATKYFFIGSASSALFLLGLAAVFGASGSFAIAAPPAGTMGALALALMGSAALFKSGVFPFQFWLPDVYEAAAPELAAFLSTSMKAAAFLLLMRLVSAAVPGSAFLVFLPVAAGFTMTLGNVMAWRQTSAARLLAYSSIAHVGYLLLGVVAWNDLGRAPAGASSVFIYLAAYLVSNFPAYAILGLTGTRTLDDLRGLGSRAPWAAGFFTLSLLSLAGVPPTAGFFGKLLIFWDAVLAHRIGLVVLAVLNSVVGLGYYFRLVRLMYLEEAPAAAAAPAPAVSARLVLWAFAAPAFVLGLLPWATDWARAILVK